MTAARLMILHKFYEPQCRVLGPPPRPKLAPEKNAILYRFTLLWLFHPFSFSFFVAGPIGVAARAALKSLTEIECLHSFNQRNARTLTEGANSSGLAGKEPLPLSLSYARKVWSAGVGICQALAVKGSL